MMVTLEGLDLREILGKMVCQEDLDFLVFQDLKEIQAFREHPALMAYLEMMEYLEKMVSLVHLVYLELKEMEVLLD